METYDWPWVEAQVERTVENWHQSAGVWEPEARPYSAEEQLTNERTHDESLRQVEVALRSTAIQKSPAEVREKIITTFGQFSAIALGLDREATTLLTDGFLPVGTSLATWARRFD